MHVAIAGNIGSGKTTLTTLLSKHYSWLPHYEDADDNPYLNDFYDDMQRWSFNLQVYFLQSRFSKVVELRQNKKTVIQDRTLYEDAYIFAPNLHAMGLMTTRDFESYMQLFKLMESLVSPPDVLLYLRASVPNRSIVSRGSSTFPVVLLILAPWASRTNPCIYTVWKGALSVSCRPSMTIRATQKKRISYPVSSTLAG